MSKKSNQGQFSPDLAKLAGLLGKFQTRLDLLTDALGYNRDAVRDELDALHAELHQLEGKVSPEAIAKFDKAIKENSEVIIKLSASVQKSFDLVKRDVDGINRTLQSYNARLSALESQQLNTSELIGVLNRKIEAGSPAEAARAILRQVAEAALIAAGKGE